MFSKPYKPYVPFSPLCAGGAKSDVYSGLHLSTSGKSRGGAVLTLVSKHWFPWLWPWLCDVNSHQVPQRHWCTCAVHCQFVIICWTTTSVKAISQTTKLGSDMQSDMILGLVLISKWFVDIQSSWCYSFSKKDSKLGKNDLIGPKKGDVYLLQFREQRFSDEKWSPLYPGFLTVVSGISDVALILCYCSTTLT